MTKIITGTILALGFLSFGLNETKAQSEIEKSVLQRCLEGCNERYQRDYTLLWQKYFGNNKVYSIKDLGDFMTNKEPMERAKDVCHRNCNNSLGVRKLQRR